MQNSLFQSLISGDSKEIGKIYTLVFPKVKRFVINNSGNKDEAKDIFQKALIQIIIKFGNRHYEKTIDIEPYLYTTCKNLWRLELKHKKRVTNASNEIYKNESNDNFDHILLEQKWNLYKEKFSELSENCRKILTLFFKKTTYKDMMINLPYTSEVVVRQRVFKCRSKLSQLIRNDVRFQQIQKYHD